jgi:murein DD-endopeptidase MepM/ murein hydrolase activator NlpD
VLWSLAAGVVLVAGVLAGLLGSWLVAASGVRWNEIARDTAEVGEDLAHRSKAAAAALTDEFAELESAAATLGEVSTALDAAVRIAADLEAMANAGLPSGPDGLETLVGVIDRLAGAIDAAFPGLAELGVTGPDGPGDALRAAGAALLAGSDVPTPVPVTGFGPFVLQYPVPGGFVTDSFGTDRGDSVHHGIDIGAPAHTPILAAADGVVHRSGWLDAGAGNGVILRHEGGWETRYFHMVSADLPVATGERVLAGQVIGNVGSTGNSSGPHLHFEIVYGPVRMDPEHGFTYIGREVGSGGPTIDLPPDGSQESHPAIGDQTSDRLRAPAALRSASDIAALSDARADIAGVQRELLGIAADASDKATVLEERRVDQQDRARNAALILYGGALLVALGLLLLWVTRPRWRDHPEAHRRRLIQGATSRSSPASGALLSTRPSHRPSVARYLRGLRKATLPRQ